MDLVSGTKVDFGVLDMCLGFSQYNVFNGLVGPCLCIMFSFFFLVISA